MQMYFPPSPFDLQIAITCSSLVDTAYDMYSQWLKQDKPDEEKFKWTPNGMKMNYSSVIWGSEPEFLLFKHKEPFAFVSWTDAGTAYLVFRGTESIQDWIADARIRQEPYALVPGYGHVHKGFYNLYQTMSEKVLKCVAAVPGITKLFITGHSLGSAISTVSVPDVLVNSKSGLQASSIFHYNLASPRVGNPDFTTAYNKNNVVTYRIVNTCDIVPEVPPSIIGKLVYEHVGTPIDYTAQYGSLGGNHNSESSYRYALLHPEQPQGVVTDG